jgi:type II secretory pathway predicted ATPase ExeA
MTEDYIKYWGLKQHPFLLAPDSGMMHTSGQYYECLERLKYAINTNKGGALLVSEDAGLGKTTLLLKLIEEMKAQHGGAVKYAFVNHPTLTPNQLIAFIAGCFADATPNDEGRPSNHFVDFAQNVRQVMPEPSTNDDKLKNLMSLKESLLEVKRQGGKNIIIVDEGQMLCGAHEVLQELRILINLTYNNEYLHTFILSGQKPLWNEVKSIPELWQRLPVRYYLVSLRLEETRELIKYRLAKAGLDREREVFASDAFEIIQRYSMGSPRTIIALADLALLIGYADRSARISFKELSKAINAMAGKGESLAYVKEEKQKREPLPNKRLDSDLERETLRSVPSHHVPEIRAELTSPEESRVVEEPRADKCVVRGGEQETPVNPPCITEEKQARELLTESVITPGPEGRTLLEQNYTTPVIPPSPPESRSEPTNSAERTVSGPPIDNSVVKEREQESFVPDKSQEAGQDRAPLRPEALKANQANDEASEVVPLDLSSNKLPGIMERPVRPRLAILTISLALAVCVGLASYIISDDVRVFQTKQARIEALFSVDGGNAGQPQQTVKGVPQKSEQPKQEEKVQSRVGQPEKAVPARPERETLITKENLTGQQKAPVQNKAVAKTENFPEARKAEPRKREEVAPTKEAAKAEKEMPVRKPVPKKLSETDHGGSPLKTEKEVIVISNTGANIRSAPDINSPRIGLFMEGEEIKVIGERKDAEGQTWYKLYMHGSREGWVSEKTVVVK